MSFQEKNIAVSLSIFSLILVFFLIRILQMVQTDSFTSPNVFRLWGIIIVLAIVGTISVTILTHILSAIIEAIRTQEEPDVQGIQDERDTLIDLRGTRITYTVSSLGVLAAMLSYVLGQPALVMFTLLILAGIFAQIVGDLSRLYLYRRGF
ncbi:MAG: hypothetical protein ACK2UW_25635 [Anaerolineales bacterium]